MVKLNSISFNNSVKLSTSKNAVNAKLLKPKKDVFVKNTNNVSFKGLDDFGYIKKPAYDAMLWGKLIKSVYDEEYGEGNWEYISIGRSCACFADALNLMGVPAHYIPISGLTNGIEHGAELTKSKGFEGYKNFIYKDGLNPENINNSGKAYIFQDYCDSGASLKKFEEFLRCEEMGLDSSNIVFEGIQQTLQKGFEKVPKEDLHKILNSMSNLYSQNTPFSFKQFTNVPKLDCRNLDEINRIKDFECENNLLHSIFIKYLQEIADNN